MSRRRRRSLYDAIDVGKPSHSVCQQIISRSVDINRRNSGDFTSLAYALFRGNFTIADALLTAGADINGIFTRDNRVIHLAVIAGNLSIVKRLCSLGADPEIQNKYGNSALHLAAIYGHYDIVCYLVINRNVTMTTTDADNQTPFDIALNQGNIQIARLLTRVGYYPTKQDSVYLHGIADCDTDVETLKQFVFRPRTLKDSCIFKLRRILGNDLQRKINTLPLSHMKDDIFFEHVT